MDIKQTPIFLHAFLLDNMRDGSSGRGMSTSKTKGDLEKAQDWCNENCDGRWMIFGSTSTSFSGGGVDVTYCSKAEHESPIENEPYPQSMIKVTGHRIISFEEETDAMAFKLFYYKDPNEGEYND